MDQGTQTKRAAPAPTNGHGPATPAPLPSLAPDRSLPLLERWIDIGRRSTPTTGLPYAERLDADGEVVRYFSVTLEVTPADAARIRQLHTFDKQRSIAPSWVKFYTDQMRRGRFGPSEMAVFVVRGEVCLIQLGNGHHRLDAAIESGETIIVSFLFFLGLSRDEAWEAYQRMDRGRVRRLEDCFNMDQLNEQIAAIGSVSKSEAGKLAPAVRLIDGDFYAAQAHSLAINYQDMTYAVPRISEFIVPFAHYRQAVRKREPALVGTILSKEVVAIGVLTMRDQPEKAKVFWARVFEGTGAPDSPEKRLYQYLLDRRAKDSADEIVRYIAVAWNAFFEERPLLKLQLREKTAAVELAGVNYGRG